MIVAIELKAKLRIEFVVLSDRLWHRLPSRYDELSRHFCNSVFNVYQWTS